MRRFQKSLMLLTAGLASGATCLQIGGCSLVGGAANLVGTTNPCLVILVCDPAAYRFARSGIDEPGVVPDQDPFCTFAPFCTPMQDPIFGGLGAPANP